MLRQNVRAIDDRLQCGGDARRPAWHMRSRGTTSTRFRPAHRLQVRTTEPIDSQTMDGRIYRGTIENDVRDTQGRLAIPRGATAELVVRRDADNDLVLDLDSVTVNGRRYGVDATRNRVGGGGIDIRNSGIGANKETARNVGGGAAAGRDSRCGDRRRRRSGGGRGRRRGSRRGRADSHEGTPGERPGGSATVLPSAERPDLDVRDSGYDRDGHHYHKYDTN